MVKFVLDYEDFWGVSLAKAKASSRYAINGVLIDVNGTVVATDGHRLHVATASVDTGLSEPVIVNFDKLPKPNKKRVMVEIKIDGEDVLARVEPSGEVVAGVVVVGKSFPAYRDVVPGNALDWKPEDVRVASVDEDYLKQARDFLGHNIAPRHEAHNKPALMASRNRLVVLMPLDYELNNSLKSIREGVGKVRGHPQKVDAA